MRTLRSSRAGNAHLAALLGSVRRRPPMLGVPVAVLLVLCLVAGSLVWPRGTISAQTAATLTLDPTQGTAGSLFSISVVDLPRLAYQHTAAISFDLTDQLDQQTVTTCSAIAGATTFGFGALCTGANVMEQVPAGAAPGSHTVTVTIQKVDVQGGQITLQGTFTVLAANTATPTITPTTTSTATTTATATGTPAPTETGTALPSAPPTATVPAAATSTPPLLPTAPPLSTSTPLPSATPTATPNHTALVLVKPLFTGHALAIAVHGRPPARVVITVVLSAQQHGSTVSVYHVTRTSTLNPAGSYVAILHPPYHGHGILALSVTLQGTGTHAIFHRSFPYNG